MLPLAAILSGATGYSTGTSGALQFFALLSTDEDYDAAVAALPAAVQYGTASHDANLIIWASPVTEDELDNTAALADLRTANYPTALCRHRWGSMTDFECNGGYHMLGESENSSEGVAGRSAVHTTRTTGAGDGSGNTLYDSIAYLDLTSFANSTLTVRHGKFWQSRTGAFNSVSTVPVATGGAATDAASITIRDDSELSPALFLDCQDISQGDQFPTDLGWTSTANLFGANTFVKANLCQPQSSVSINSASIMFDVGGADPYENLVQQEDRLLQRVDTVGELSAEVTFWAGGRTGGDCAAAPFGAPDAAIQDDGGAFTDLTTEIASATTADVPMFPGTAATNDAFYVGHTEVWSALELTLSTAGVGDYTLAYEYWNGSSWASIPSYTFHGTGTGSEEWKSTSGSAGGDPRFIFNPPDDWATTTVNGQGPFYFIRFRYASGTMSTSPVASQGQVEGTFYVVHLKDGATPTIVLPGPGLGLGIDVSHATRPGQVQIVNLSVLGCNNFMSSFTPGDGNVLPTIYRVKGGRYLYGQSAYQNGKMDEWAFLPADKVPPWDTSDRPSYDNDVDIQAHVDSFGYDASEWSADEIAKICQMRYVCNGPHPSNAVSGGGAEGGSPDYWPIDGILVQKVGFDFKGIAFTGAQAEDMHSCSTIRGACSFTTPSTHRRLILDDGHTHVYHYATSDTNQGSPIDGNNSDIGPLTIENSIIRGLGVHSPTSGPGGMKFGGDSGNGNLRDNGQGVRDITLDGISLVDLVQAGNNDSLCFSWSWDQLPTIGSKGFRFVRSRRGIGAGSAGSVSALYVVKEDSLGNFTDITSSAYNGNTNDAFTASPQVGERLWLGYRRWPFRTAIPTIVTSGIGSSLTAVWRYLESGTTLQNVSTGGSFSDGTSTLTAATGARTLVFDKPGTWSQSDFGGNLPTAAYWICLEITAGTYSTVPQISTVQGPRMGGYFKLVDAGKMYFEDMEGPWIGVTGLNAFYDEDRRTLIVDRFTGRLKSGETISTFGMFFQAAAGDDTEYTLSQVKGGQLDKSITTSEVIEDNVGVIAANVSTTPGEDIEEVA